MFICVNVGVRDGSPGTPTVQTVEIRFYRCHVFYFVIWHQIFARHKNYSISKLQYFPNCTYLHFCMCWHFDGSTTPCE